MSNYWLSFLFPLFSLDEILGQLVNFHIPCHESSNLLDIECVHSILASCLFLNWTVHVFVIAVLNSYFSLLLQLSYQIVDSMIWLGIRDMINDVRKKKLKLRPVTYLSGSQGSESDVPHGYIWSPHLVPKPKGYALSFSMYLWNEVFDLIYPSFFIWG